MDNPHKIPQGEGGAGRPLPHANRVRVGTALTTERCPSKVEKRREGLRLFG